MGGSECSLRELKALTSPEEKKPFGVSQNDLTTEIFFFCCFNFLLSHQPGKHPVGRADVEMRCSMKDHKHG